MHWHRRLMINLDHREIMMKRFPARWGNWGSALLSTWLVTSGNRMEFNNVHLWFLCSFILSGRSSLLGDPTPWPWVANLQKSKVGHPPTQVCIWSTLSFALVSLTDYRGLHNLKEQSPPGKEPIVDITFWSVCPSSKAPFHWFLFSSILIHLLSSLSFWSLFSRSKYLRGVFI